MVGEGGLLLTSGNGVPGGRPARGGSSNPAPTSYAYKPRIQFTTHPKVVGRASCAAALCQQRALVEGPRVKVDGHDARKGDGRYRQLHIVVVQVDEARAKAVLDDKYCDPKGEVAVDAV